MTTEIVLSPVMDEKINSDITNSPIWKKAYKPDEVTDYIRQSQSKWYEYHIRFDGLKPIHMTKFKEL